MKFLKFLLLWLGNLSVGFLGFCFGFGPAAWLGEIANYPRVGYTVGMVFGVLNAILVVVYLARHQADDAVEFDP